MSTNRDKARSHRSNHNSCFVDNKRRSRLITSISTCSHDQLPIGPFLLQTSRRDVSGKWLAEHSLLVGPEMPYGV
jgi:hypothetical protein